LNSLDETRLLDERKGKTTTSQEQGDLDVEPALMMTVHLPLLDLLGVSGKVGVDGPGAGTLTSQRRLLQDDPGLSLSGVKLLARRVDLPGVGCIIDDVHRLLSQKLGKFGFVKRRKMSGHALGVALRPLDPGAAFSVVFSVHHDLANAVPGVLPLLELFGSHLGFFFGREGRTGFVTKEIPDGRTLAASRSIFRLNNGLLLVGVFASRLL